MPLNLFYTMVQKSQKWPKTQIKGGPALIKGFLIVRILSNYRSNFSLKFVFTNQGHDLQKFLAYEILYR